MKASNKSVLWLSITAMMMAVVSTHGESLSKERLDKFLGSDTYLTKLSDIDSQGLQVGGVAVQPWSDTYWPDRNGSIAVPYGDFWGTGLPLSWGLNRGRVLSFIPKSLNELDKMSDGQLDHLPASVKYDAISGNTNLNLSRKIIEAIDGLDADKQTALWGGICHGWSPASLKLDRPLHSFTVPIFNGKRRIKFYPSDVKALESFTWANSYAQDYIRMEGVSCKREMRGKKDRNGRLLDPSCFDVNPAIFHLSLINLIGKQKTGFIMDRAWDDEIQNQPVRSYAYSYFPLKRAKITGKDFGGISSKAMLANGAFDDRYKTYRDQSRVASLVGVFMKVKYVKESDPKQRETDSPENDNIQELTFLYDLELDKDGNVIGGEWMDTFELQATSTGRGIPQRNLIFSDGHPDFIWYPPADLKAWSVADFDIKENSSWDGVSEMPQDWKNASVKATENTYHYRYKNSDPTRARPQVVAKIVDMLIERSRK